MAFEDQSESGSRLAIDLAAIRANYRTIAQHVAPAETGAVVKANAYGLGVERVAPALQQAGCRTFFVAHLREALELVRILGSATDIFVMNGLDPGDEESCAETGLVPMLNTPGQVARWHDRARQLGRRLPAALQVDSGMSRLGLAPDIAARLAQDEAFRRDVPLRLIMSHLACADEPRHPANCDQLAALKNVCSRFPAVPVSIANSGGIFLSRDFHLDLVRPGLALWGVAANDRSLPLHRVVTLEGRVLQIRSIEAAAGVGYGLDYVAPAARCIATIGVGYGDGWPRSLSGKGAVRSGGRRLPVVGRVSMDSLTVDISDLPHHSLVEGDLVELVGPSQSLEDVARDADTISYEILTRLGARYTRTYVDDGAVTVHGGRH